MSTTRSILLLSVAAASFLPAARADLDVGITAEIRLGRALPPRPPEVVVVEEIGPPGPPPWAARHWYRRNHAYYYYPGYAVYYRPADRMWFYLDGGTWRLGARLPGHIHVDFDRAVSLNIESDRPYVYHERVVTYYPSNYFTRVKIKSRPDHRRDDRPGHDDRDDRGKSRGQGKK